MKSNIKIDEGFMSKNHMTIEGQIVRFLIEVNKRMDGVHLEETSEMASTLVKFEALLTNVYANRAYWSPTKLFHQIIAETVKKYFDVDPKDLGWNNTRTVFWLSRSDIETFLVHQNCKHMIDKKEENEKD